MARPLAELGEVQRALDGIPIVCAGDIFDRWNSPAELINFAIKQLPHMFAVPGQHDLPYHSLDDIRKSAYWTLVEAGKITHLTKPLVFQDANMQLHPFPWGKTDYHKEPERGGKERWEVAVIHRYIWKLGSGHMNADPGSKIDKFRKALAFYDAAVFGDNHKGFYSILPPRVFNCGTMMRRKADELLYSPQIGLFLDDGNFERYPLDCSLDQHCIPFKSEGQTTEEADMESFLEELKDLGRIGLDFHTMVTRFLEKHGDNIEPLTRHVLLEAVE